jgi:hypothetical protein
MKYKPKVKLSFASDWCRTGVGLALDWCRTGVGLASDWRRTGVGLALDWRQTGVGQVSDWRRTGVGLASEPKEIPDNRYLLITEVTEVTTDHFIRGDLVPLPP